MHNAQPRSGNLALSSILTNQSVQPDSNVEYDVHSREVVIIGRYTIKVPKRRKARVGMRERLILRRRDLLDGALPVWGVRRDYALRDV